MYTEKYRQHGLSLIELIIFIVVVGVGLAGILTVFNVATKNSADPLINKQMLAIGEAVLEEVQLQPFTWCYPSDPNAATAVAYTSCSSGMQQYNVNPNVSRGSTTAPLDNVLDYNGQNITNDISVDTTMPAGYAASVAVAPVSNLGPGGAQIGTNVGDANAALLITVTVSYTPSGSSLVLQGYRTRYAPNSLP